MILLTGPTGFIGGHLLDGLIDAYGSENIVLLTSRPFDKCRFLLHNGYKFEKNLFVDGGFEDIDTIIHAGAYTPKSDSESNNISSCNSNITSTTRLISSTFPNVKKIIFLSTLDVYGYDHPIKEDTVVNPVSLYGYSKLYCENLVKGWASSKNIIYQILRVGHVYGNGEEAYQKVIPATMHRIQKGLPVQLYGEGTAIRSFIHVKDVVRAIKHAIELKKSEDIINIVGEEKISISNLMNKIMAISKMNPKIENVEIGKKPRDLIFDNSKMKDLLCIPQVNLSEGLVEEWDYMKALYA